ncbi:MAG TPA: hypothetical protein VKM55_12925 [Candidatus Lokiarchaeia archaeon]|nr:hypothetical protein [Candidatus Lokiarchaeia archaeon]
MAESYDFLEDLKKTPFLVIIGKYDHILGPRPLYFSSVLADQGFIERVLRDALHTKSKYVNLDFDQLYAQGDKIEVDDPAARGKKQLYVVVLLREASLPPIPPIYFKRIEMLFMKLGRETILLDNPEVFEAFSTALNEIYLEKKEVLPLESLNHQIRSGVNTIQGFCELLIDEQKNKGCFSEQDVLLYVDMMLDSCNEIIKALDEHFS